MKSHPGVHTLYLHSNLLTSFEGFEPQPNLRTLHVPDNYIESFRGIKPLPSLETLVLRGNPITALYHYRTMAIAAIGKQLRNIDGETVKKHEIERAERLGKAVAEAIREGWLLDTMQNPDSDYDLTLEQYLHARKFGTLGTERVHGADEYVTRGAEARRSSDDDLEAHTHDKDRYSRAYSVDDDMLHQRTHAKASQSQHRHRSPVEEPYGDRGGDASMRATDKLVHIDRLLEKLTAGSPQLRAQLRQLADHSSSVPARADVFKAPGSDAYYPQGNAVDSLRTHPPGGRPYHALINSPPYLFGRSRDEVIRHADASVHPRNVSDALMDWMAASSETRAKLSPRATSRSPGGDRSGSRSPTDTSSSSQQAPRSHRWQFTRRSVATFGSHRGSQTSPSDVAQPQPGGSRSHLQDQYVYHPAYSNYQARPVQQSHRSDDDMMDRQTAARRPAAGSAGVTYPPRGWIVATGGQPCTSRSLKRAVFSQWATVLDPPRMDSELEHLRYGANYPMHYGDYASYGHEHVHALALQREGDADSEDGRSARQLVVRSASHRNNNMSVVAVLTQQADAEAIKAQQALKLVEVCLSVCPD
jgi:hypothetical protein